MHRSISIFFIILFLVPVPTFATETLPPSVRRLLGEVRRLIDRQAYDQAVDTIVAFQSKAGPPPADPASDADPHRHAMVFFAMGHCRLLQERYVEAEAALDQALRRRPDLTAAWLNLAKACYEQGRYGAAAGHFAQAYDRGKQKDATHLYYSAVAYLMAGDHRHSLEAFDRLFTTHAGQIRPEWKAHRVHALLGAGRGRSALPVIRELIEHYAGDQRARWQEILLHQYLKLEMTAEAVAYARRLTHEAPQTARWWKLLGQIRLDAGDETGALAALTIYGYLTPLTEEERRLRADLSLQLGIPAWAAPVYAELLAQTPDDAMVIRLATALRQLGRCEEALAHLDRFAGTADDPDLLMLRADLLYELKRFAEAAGAYQTVAQKDHSRQGQAWLMAGYAAWRGDDPNLGRHAFTEAARFKPQRKSALAALRQLER